MNPHRHPNGERKSIEDLLSDLIWQGAIAVWQRALILQELQAIKEGMSTMPSEVVTQLNAKFDEIQAALQTESGEIQAAIAAANEGDATPEEVAALNARADGIKAAIAALVTAPDA